MVARDVGAEWAELVRGGFFAEYTYEARRRYQKSATALNTDPTAWILEIGCGTGRYHTLLRQLGYRNIVSCDLTFEHVSRAREINPDGLFVVASGENLPFKAQIFDALVTNAAIEHFSDPRRGVSEFSRVTTPTSRLVVTSDCFSWRILQMMGLYKSKMPIDRTMTYSGFRKLFRGAGLEIVESDAWGITHYLRRAARVSRHVGRLVEAASRDEHWSNRQARSRILTHLRMVVLDENLFVLRKSPGSSAVLPAARGSMSLLDIVECTACRGALREEAAASRLVCVACGVHFPVSDGVPNFA